MSETMTNYLVKGVIAGAFALIMGAFLFAGQAFAANTINTAVYRDANANGTVENIRWTFDENVTGCTYDAADWTVNTAGSIGVTAVTALTCTTSDAILDITVTTTANVTGGATAPVISYANAGTAGSVTLTSGVLTAKTGGDVPTITDAAAPVLVSVSPASGATGAVKTASIIWTFSEPMVTTIDEGTEFTMTPDPASFTDAWTVSNTVATLTLSTPMLCGTTYTIALDENELDASAGSSTNLVTFNDYSFIVGSCSAASIEAQPAPVYGIEIEAGVSPEVLEGEILHIDWTPTGPFNFVDITYTESGVTTVIADNTQNDGTYAWTVPASITADSITITVKGTDLVDVLATDSVVFTVSRDEEVVEEEEETDGTDEGCISCEASALGIEPGDLVKSSVSSAVYYIDENFSRKPFSNSATYFTWYSDFSAVKTLSSADLALFDLGTSMLPKAGVVLVKIQSVNNVYALTPGADGLTPVLRHILTENIAKAMYGADWADYVIDVEPTFFTKFGTGEEIEASSDITVDRTVMKKRVNLK